MSNWLQMQGLYPNFYFFIGNSGAGKDTSMELFWQTLNENGIRATNLKRYITRTGHFSEDFISIDVPSFKKMAKDGKFSFYWKIYDNYYGYTKSDIEKCIAENVVVLFNISRSLTSVVASKFPGCRFIEVIAPKSVSSERVIKRKRSNEKNITKRIERMDREFELPEDRIIIDNSGTLDDLYEKIRAIVDKIYLTQLSI